MQWNALRCNVISKGPSPEPCSKAAKPLNLTGHRCQCMTPPLGGMTKFHIISNYFHISVFHTIVWWKKKKTEVPVHDPSTGRNDKMASIPFILPHELLHNLLQKDPDLLPALSGSQLEPGLENLAEQKPNKHTKKKQVCKTSRTSSVPSLVSPLTNALAWVSLGMVCQTTRTSPLNAWHGTSWEGAHSHNDTCLPAFQKPTHASVDAVGGIQLMQCWTSWCEALCVWCNAMQCNAM